MQIIGVDVGRNKVKAVSAKGRVDFPSVVGEWQQRNLATNYGDYEVIVDQQKVFIGDLAVRGSYCQREMATDTKMHQESKILFLSALALLAKEREQINVVTSLPVTQHTPTVKNEFDTVCANTEGFFKIGVGKWRK